MFRDMHTQTHMHAIAIKNKGGNKFEREHRNKGQARKTAVI